MCAVLKVFWVLVVTLSLVSYSFSSRRRNVKVFIKLNEHLWCFFSAFCFNRGKTNNACLESGLCFNDIVLDSCVFE